MEDGSDLNGWDDLLDPYQYAREKGIQEGRRAGLQSGFQNGQALGHVKALEMGVELGYMKSIVTQRMEEEEVRIKKSHHGGKGVVVLESEGKKLERMKQLLEAIESFPTPDEMFASSTSNLKELNDITNVVQSISLNEAQAQAQDINSGNGVNIVETMQRVRAKFTLFLKQSKLSHLSLKKVMDSATNESGNCIKGESAGAGGFESPQTNEW